uniref:Triple functional domain protein n=1 Tax=Macrostomum lignano TaxID=282301 RepID=A0A1I8GXV2_9PLAT
MQIRQVVQAPVHSLEAEAARLAQWLRCGSKGESVSSSWVSMNTDFQQLAPAVTDAIQHLYELRSLLVDKWESTRVALEQAYQLRLFEEDVGRMANWMQQQRTFLLDCFGDIGQSAQQVISLIDSHKTYLANCDNAKDQMRQLEIVAEQLFEAGHYAGKEMTMRSRELTLDWQAVLTVLADRSKVLDLSYCFHHRTEDYLSRVDHWTYQLDRLQLADRCRSIEEVEGHLATAQTVWEQEQAAYNEACFAGKAIITHLQTPAPNALVAEINFEVSRQHCLSLIHRLLHSHRCLDSASSERKKHLYHRLSSLHFKQDCAQVLAWLSEHGDPFLAKQVYVGKSMARAETLYNAHMQFEQVANNTIVNADKLIRAVDDLVPSAEMDTDGLLTDAENLKRRIDSFTRAMANRREALDVAAGFYHRTRELLEFVSRLKTASSQEKCPQMEPSELEKAIAAHADSIQMANTSYSQLSDEGTYLLNLSLDPDEDAYIRNVLSQVRAEVATALEVADHHRLRLDLCQQLHLFEEDWENAQSVLSRLPAQLPTQPTEMRLEELEQSIEEHIQAVKRAEEVLLKGGELINVFESVGMDFHITDEEDALGRLQRLLTELDGQAQDVEERRTGLNAELEWRQLEAEGHQIIQWISNGDAMLAASATKLPHNHSEAEQLKRDHDKFRDALERTFTSAYVLVTKLEQVKSDHPRCADVRDFEQSLQLRWNKLLSAAEERSKLINAALNWFISVDQVSQVLKDLQKDYSRSEDACSNLPGPDRVQQITERAQKHNIQKDAFLRGCRFARRTSEAFMKYLHRSGGQHAGSVEALVVSDQDQLTQAESQVLESWTQRKRVIDLCQQYVTFESSAQQLLSLLTPCSSSSAVPPDTAQKVEILYGIATSFARNGHSHCAQIRQLVAQFDRYVPIDKAKRQLLGLETPAEQKQPQQQDSSTRASSGLGSVSSVTSGASGSASSGISSLDSKAEQRQLAGDKKRRYILNELINTERVYVKDLHTCITQYKEAMFSPPSGLQTPPGIVGKERIIFGNIEAIYEFHNGTFLGELEKYASSFLPEDTGHCFVSFGKQLAALYVEYCVNKTDSAELLISQAGSFFEEVQARLSINGPLQSYLIKPVQRITKYQLLLKELLDNCELASTSEIQEGLDAMIAVPKKANDALHLSMLDGLPDGDRLARFGDVLLHDSFVVWEPRQLIRKGRDRHVFLFDLFIVFAKEVAVSESDSGGGGGGGGGYVSGTKTRYQFKQKFALSNCSITEQVDSDPCKFGMWPAGAPIRDEYRLILKANCLETKQQWVNLMRENIQDKFCCMPSLYPRNSLSTGSKSSDSSMGAAVECSVQEDYQASKPGELTVSAGQLCELIELLPGEIASVRLLSDNSEGQLPAAILRKTPQQQQPPPPQQQPRTSFRKWLPKTKKPFRRSSKSELLETAAALPKKLAAAQLKSQQQQQQQQQQPQQQPQQISGTQQPAPAIKDALLDNVSEESVELELPPPMEALQDLPALDNEGDETETDLGQAIFVARHYIPLKDEAATLDQLPSPPADLKEKWRLVWGNWLRLLDGHRELLARARQAVETSGLDSVADVFIAKERHLTSWYSKYCENHRKAQHIACEQHKDYFEQVRLALRDKEDMNSHLMNPVQRCMRYSLLVGVIVEKARKDGLGGPALAAWERVHRLMRELPCKTESIMEASRIDHLEPGIRVTALGQMRCKAVLNVCHLPGHLYNPAVNPAVSQLKFEQRKVFLFDQMMLVTEPKATGNNGTPLLQQRASRHSIMQLADTSAAALQTVYLYRGKVKVNNMRFNSNYHSAAESGESALLFAVTDVTPGDVATFVFEAGSAPVRQQLVAELTAMQQQQADFLKLLQNPVSSGCGGVGAGGIDGFDFTAMTAAAAAPRVGLEDGEPALAAGKGKNKKTSNSKLALASKQKQQLSNGQQQRNASFNPGDSSSTLTNNVGLYNNSLPAAAAPPTPPPPPPQPQLNDYQLDGRMTQAVQKSFFTNKKSIQIANPSRKLHPN